MNKEQYETLNKKGWVEFNEDSTNISLIKTATRLGKLAKHPNGQPIGVLKPKNENSSIKGTLSNRHGLGRFPLHTDTAFWESPAHYLLLHSENVSSCYTLVLPLSEIWKSLTIEDKKDASHAIYLVKTIHRQFYSSLLFRVDNLEGIKYDSSCMKPFNLSAKRIHQKLERFLNRIEPSILPTKFICTACELKLEGYNALSAASIANHYTRRTIYTPEEYYDMISPEDYDGIRARYDELNLDYSDYSEWDNE